MKSYTIQRGIKMKQMDEHFKELVYKYTNKLYATAYNLCNNPSDAEDIVQETFMKYLKKKPIFANEEHEKAWLLRVTINNAKNIRRSFARQGTSLDENLPFTYTENTDVLNEVLSLPEKYRVVIHLYYYEGYSIKEIAEILNIGMSTVISHRKNITDKLGKKSISALTIYAVMHGYVDINKI